ncbi:MAG: triose-phosphate isomerase, partial [Bacteroidetes bacterium]|nr:triose-phosphate isomerase [Bacteroidota bacterium]
MPKKIIAGNWKMNKSYDEGLKLVSEITKLINGDVLSDIQIVIAPPFIHLYSIGKLISTQTKIALGAQNCYSKSSGAFTGEVS